MSSDIQNCFKISELMEIPWLKQKVELSVFLPPSVRAEEFHKNLLKINRNVDSKIWILNDGAHIQTFREGWTYFIEIVSKIYTSAICKIFI